MMLSPWHLMTLVAMACGAVIPGPCSFAPDQRWDCSLGDPCPEGFACAQDGFCKSADIACGDGERLCSYESLERVGICVSDDEFSSSTAHCGDCFNRCHGGGGCEDGVCVGGVDAGACVVARGHYDCPGGEVCVDDDDDDDGVGACVAGSFGAGGTFGDCDSGDDCEGGLCAYGVCSRPCDIGCPAFMICDDDAIPGGLCVPSDDAAICAGL